jgi:hypothetical protein
MNVEEVKNLVADLMMHSDLAAAVKALGEQLTDVKLQAEKLNWLFEDEAGEEVGPDEEPVEPVKEEAGEGTAEEVAEEADKEGTDHPEIPKDEIEEIAKDHVEAGDTAEDTAEDKDKSDKSPEKKDMSLASGTNTFVPNVDKKKYEEMELTLERYSKEAQDQRLIAENYAQRVLTADAEKQAIDKIRVELEHKYSMLNRKVELIELSGKYQFDVEAEMKIVEAMTDDQFTMHKNVVSRYAMPPVNKAPISVAELKDDDVIEKDDVIKVAKYALEKGITWKQANDILKGK